MARSGPEDQPPWKRPKLMSSNTMETELTSQQRVFCNDDLVRYVVQYVVDEYALVFVLTCRGFRRAHASLRLGPILSKVSFYCESAALVKWAISMGCPTTGAINHMRTVSLLCDHAAGNGSGDIGALQWLRRGPSPHEWSATTCGMAAKKGRLEMLQWLRGQEPPCPWDGRTCAGAAAGGHLEVLQWLRGQEPPCPWNTYTCWEAAEEGGHFEVLQWLCEVNKDPPPPWDP